MGKIVSIDRLSKKEKLSKKSYDTYMEALERRSKRNKIDYKKLMFGTPEEKAIEEVKQARQYRKQSMIEWTNNLEKK